MRIVVTGGSGYLGGLVLKKLADERKVKSIIALDRVPPAVASPKVKWTIADLRDPGLDRHFEGADALVHLAFIVTQRASREQRHAVNVEGSRRMFEHAANAGLQKIVYASSIAAYGLQPGRSLPITEDSERTRSSEIAYFENKWDVEALLDEFERARPGIAVTRLRPAILLGARMDAGVVRVLRSGALAAFGAAPLPIVWDEDVADAVLAALTRDVRGAFNLAADEPLEPRALLAAAGLEPRRVPRALTRAGAALAARLASGFDPDWFRALDAELVVSSERARRELEWKPRCPTAVDVMRRLVENAPLRTDRRLRTFFRLLEIGARTRDPQSLPEDVRRMKLMIHLELLGRAGGDYAFHVDRGTIRLKRGIPRPPDSTVSLSAETLIRLLAGLDDPTRARLAGRVRIRGEPNGGFIVSGMVTSFRAALDKPGFEGWSTRQLERWFARAAREKGFES